MLEYERNEDAVRLLFKLKEIKKSILNLSTHLKNIKVINESSENYIRCLRIYQEASCYYFQCCGFLKSQYFNENASPASKNFLINNLFIPSYKRFLELRRTLSTLKVESIYETSLIMLKNNVETINNSLSKFLNEI